MDPIEPWIDADALRRLARQLVAPPQVSAPRPDGDPGFGPGFEGFIPASAKPSDARYPVPGPREDSPSKPFEPKPARLSSPPLLPEQEGPRGPLVARMEGFRDWLERAMGARGLFILDRDGDPVIEAPAYAKLHFLARSLAQAYRPVQGEVGNVHVKVGADAYLAVVPVDTEFGRLVLGAVLCEPLDAQSVGIVSEALSRAARPSAR